MASSLLILVSLSLLMARRSRNYSGSVSVNSSTGTIHLIVYYFNDNEIIMSS
jgi:hypothetical protein